MTVALSIYFVKQKINSRSCGVLNANLIGRFPEMCRCLDLLVRSIRWPVSKITDLIQINGIDLAHLEHRFIRY